MQTSICRKSVKGSKRGLLAITQNLFPLAKQRQASEAVTRFNLVRSTMTPLRAKSNKPEPPDLPPITPADHARRVKEIVSH
jgi:hypothetical protein